MLRKLSRRTICALLGALPGLAAVRCGAPSRRLTFYNWGDYLAPEVASRFAALKDGAAVTQDFYLSEAELFAKLKVGASYDLCVPIDYQLERLSEHKFLRALDMKRLPGAANLGPRFPPWRSHDDPTGACYAIPYLWGTTGIGYDSDEIKPAPTSWKALFDVAHAGRISVIDSKGDVFDQALLAAGLDINSNDKSAIRSQIFPMLVEQKKILRAYDSSPARALVAGETHIAQIDSGDLMRAQKEKPSLRYVIPEEGAALWVDYVAIPAASVQRELATRFIEFLLDPEIAALNANFLRFATPNQAALDRGLVVDRDDPQIYPPEPLLAKLYVSEHWVGETESLVDKLWLELRGG
jgi:spermidine/putrescine transport system substrate-binding protein